MQNQLSYKEWAFELRQKRTTHFNNILLGSGSSAIHPLFGAYFVGCELDKDYFDNKGAFWYS